MKILIIIQDGQQPAIIETSPDKLLKEAGLFLHKNFKDEAELKNYLSVLKPPSGVYDSLEEAQKASSEASHQAKLQNDARLLDAIQATTGLTQKDLTEAIGFRGENDGKPVRRILAAEQGLSGPSRRLLAYLVRDGQVMTKAEEEEILGAVKNPRKPDLRVIEPVTEPILKAQ